LLPEEITAAGADVPGSWPQEALGRDWGDGAYWDDFEALAARGSRSDPRGTGDQGVDDTGGPQGGFEAIVRNKTRVIDVDLAAYLDAAPYCPPIHGV
jgi:hypothetical protein